MYMKKNLLLWLFLLFLLYNIFILLIPHNQEGFNTYFRQTIRPHIRNFKDVREILTFHFNTKFNNFGRIIGFFY